jgi:hypothetical protein
MMDTNERRASWIFRVAAIYGILVLLPQYFLEERLARDFPPPLTHPEHFYGFVGVALAWQFAFLVVARDVRRFRPLMIPAILEKLAFGIAAPVLYLQGRVAAMVAAFGLLDLVIAACFAIAYMLTRDVSDSNQPELGRNPAEQR